MCIRILEKGALTAVIEKQFIDSVRMFGAAHTTIAK
jgi:hypothetical protein